VDEVGWIEGAENRREMKILFNNIPRKGYVKKL